MPSSDLKPRKTIVPLCRLLAGLCLLVAMTRSAAAQVPGLAPPPGSGGSLLGPAPGSGGDPTGEQIQRDEGFLGGRAGTGFPRVPASIGRPGETQPRPTDRGVQLPAPLPEMTPPVFGSLEIPEGPVDEGPPDGLTLDQAIALLIQQSLDLQAVQLEIPKAEADLLTASLRNNPIFFADSQLIPYGNYSQARPGGPTQYDVNITFPIDFNGQRKARMASAARARNVVQAQYQNAVRLQIDNVYTAFVDALAARETVRFAQASVEGLEQIIEVTTQLQVKGLVTSADVERVAVQLDAAQLALEETLESEREAHRALGLILHMDPEEAEALQVRGALHMPPLSLPPLDELQRVALESRPDLAAFRLGALRASADVKLAESNRYENPFLLVQPYTFQDNSPYDTKSAHSFAVGVTVPLPVFNRNQGNIQRARINREQTQLQVQELERRILNEVQRDERSLAVTGAAIRRLEQSTLPRAERGFATSGERLSAGEEDLIAYLGALRDYNDVVRQYRDVLIRHRRSMLRLNTAVGHRILP